MDRSIFPFTVLSISSHTCMFSPVWVRFNSLPPADKPQQNQNKTVQEMSQRNWFSLFSVHALDLIFSLIKHGTILVLKVVEIFLIITKAFQICRFFLISEQAPVLGAEFPVIYNHNVFDVSEANHCNSDSMCSTSRASETQCKCSSSWLCRASCDHAECNCRKGAIFKFASKRYHIFILQLADFMKQSVYSLVSDIAKNSEEDLKTENAVLKLQIELMKWQQTQAITEVARNHGKNI